LKALNSPLVRWAFVGGVWLHLNYWGRGLFYSGDFSLESTFISFHYAAESQQALLDASYGLYDKFVRAIKSA